MLLFPADDQTVAGASASLRAGRLSCGDLLNRCLREIDAREDQVHAWVSVDRDGALARAHALDDDLRAGHWRGALHGIPVGVKDIIDVAGWITACGSPLLENNVAARDAPIVARLRDAGAVILGKTVTTQFACFDPPATRNPWNLDRTPGGSSSGSAAAVAAGMCLAALGSQTGGSITRPASFCGVCGLKPTWGALSLQGIFPLAPSLDHPGPIAATVGDLAIVWNVLSGAALPDGVPPHDPPARAAPRLRRLRGIFDDRADDDMRAALAEAVVRFAACGAVVGEGVLPESFGDVLAQHRTLMLYELHQVHAGRFAAHRGEYRPIVSSLIDEGACVSRAAYDAARDRRQTLCDQMAAVFGDCDALVCPAAPGAAPGVATTGDPAFNSPWSFLGLPVVSFPVGLSRDGLPLAIQLVGRAGGESRLLGVARWCENAVREAHYQSVAKGV